MSYNEIQWNKNTRSYTWTLYFDSSECLV